MDLYLQELSFWREEVRRRIEEGTIPAHLSSRLERLGALAERRVMKLSSCTPDRRSGLEADANRLVRLLSKEACDAVKQGGRVTAISV